MTARCLGRTQLRAGMLILCIVTSVARADAEGAYAVGQNIEHWSGGGAWDHPDAESARSSALTSCQKDSSVGSSCKVVATVSRKCLALALSSKDVRLWSLNIDPDIQLAKQEALQSCQKNSQGPCTIRAEFCDKLGAAPAPTPNPALPPAAQGGGAGGTACQRYPNLC